MKSVWVVGALVVGMLAGGCANVERLEMQVADLSSRLAATEAERDRLQDDVAGLQERNQALRQQLTEAQAGTEELAELRRRLGGGIEVSLRGGLVVIELPERVLYRSGQAKLTTGGKATLRKVAAALNSQFADYPVRVEGHTDSDPIRRTRKLYKSNWELSAVRALEVVHFLTEQCGLDAKRVHAAAFGQHQPVAPNTTPASKQRNRRVAIVVLPGGKK